MHLRKMKNIIAIFLVALFTVIEANAGNSPKLIPYRKNDKWGYCTKNKKIVITPIYDDASFFDDNVAWVKKDRVWALIDSKGKELTPFKYSLGYVLYLNTDFCVNGLISVIVNNKFGYITDKGEEVIPCIYDRATFFEKGAARVKSNGTWVLINNKGKEITSTRYDEIYDFHEDIAIVRVGEKIGYIDRMGNAITQLIYDTKSFENNNCKGDFRNGYARVCKNDSCGCINRNGNLIIPLQFKYVVDFVSKYFVVHNFDKNTRSIYSQKGKQLFKKSYYNVAIHQFGFIAAEWVDKELLYNEYTFKGKLIKINLLPDSVKYTRLNKSLFTFRSNEWNGLGICTKTGKMLFPENYFNKVERNQNMIEVSRTHNNNLCIGFLNKEGKIIIPAIYRYAFDFVGDNVILIDQKGLNLVMDKSGRVIIPPNYDDIKRVTNGFYYAGTSYEVQNSYNNITVYGYVSPNGIEYWEDSRKIHKPRSYTN